MKKNIDLKVSSKVLYDILTIKRPHGGTGVAKVCDKYLRRIKGADSRIVDGFGNVIVGVNCKVSLTDYDDLPRNMFSCHVDTVHREDGSQNITIESGELEFVSLASKDSNCLGSDDAAGLWVMLNLIANKVTGVYIFHMGEEKGCLGSEYLLANHTGFIKHFNQCIAIDRKGTESIITQQWGGVCCSDTYANELAVQLGMSHEIDPTGVVTDSATYMDDIEECTNISAGYYNEHTSREFVNVTYLEHLIVAMSNVKWSELPINRDCDNQYIPYAYSPYLDGDYDYDYAYDFIDYHSGRDLYYYRDLVYTDPETAADLLFDLTRSNNK